MGFRQTEMQRMVRELPEYPVIRKILDLGCATGLLGLGVIGERKDISGILYDRPAMEPAIRESIRLTGLEGRAVPMTGDYLADDIGEGYDLIMAIATLSFVEQELASLMKKLYKAMNPGGVLPWQPASGALRNGPGSIPRAMWMWIYSENNLVKSRSPDSEAGRSRLAMGL